MARKERKDINLVLLLIQQDVGCFSRCVVNSLREDKLDHAWHHRLSLSHRLDAYARVLLHVQEDSTAFHVVSQLSMDIAWGYVPPCTWDIFSHW